MEKSTVVVEVEFYHYVSFKYQRSVGNLRTKHCPTQCIVTDEISDIHNFFEYILKLLFMLYA